MRLTASSLERVSACPGSYWAEQGLRAPKNSAAEQGDRLHAAMERGACGDNMSCEEKRIIATTTALGHELRARVGFVNWGTWDKERYFAWHCEAGDLGCKIDYVEVQEEAALVVDYKFGYAVVESAEVNLQLRAYALAVWDEWPELQRIHVAILQPHADRERRISLVTYEREDLGCARTEMVYLMRGLNQAENDPDLRFRIPGAHCRYCKALGTERCPESQEAARLLSVIDTSAILPTGTDLSDLLDRIPAVEALCVVLKDHARKEFAAGRAVPGYELKPGYRVRRIPDALRAWGRLADAIDPEDFAAACRVSVGVLQDAYAAKKGLRGASAKQEFDALMEPVMDWEQQAERLVNSRRTD